MPRWTVTEKRASAATNRDNHSENVSGCWLASDFGSFLRMEQTTIRPAAPFHYHGCYTSTIRTFSLPIGPSFSDFRPIKNRSTGAHNLSYLELPITSSGREKSTSLGLSGLFDLHALVLVLMVSRMARLLYAVHR